MQEVFGISGTLLGVLGSAYFYPYAIMQIPSGLLADSWGPRKSVSVFFLLSALGSALMGVAPNSAVAILGRIMVGLGVSTLFVSNFKILAEWFSPRQFVIMGGIFIAMGGVGALFSSVPLAWISSLIGWRMTLMSVGAASLVTALLVYGFVRNRPSDVGLAPISLSPEGEPVKKMSLPEGVKLVVVSGRFWALALWVFSTAGISFALGALWGGPYLMHVYGLSKAQASGVLSMYAFALILGSPFVGWLANQIGRKPILLGSSLIMVAVCGHFYLFTDRLSLTTIHVLYFLLQFAGAATAPAATAMGKELFPVSIAGTSVGLLNIFPFLGGGVFQVVVGAIVTRAGLKGGAYTAAGYQDMFLFYLLASSVSLVVVFFLRETLGRKEPE